MEGFSLLGLRNDFRKNFVSMAFQGMVSQDILSLIGQSIRKASDSEVLSKRLFSMVVELAQNIHHYSATKMYSEKDQKEVGVGVIAISETDEFYRVSSGNQIPKEHVEPFSSRCDYINALTKDGLKKFYVEQRKMPQRKDKPGANIGLIEMVRKSGNLLEYRIEEVSDVNSFLIITVKIKKEIQEN